MSTLDLSIIGNGNYNALLDKQAKIVWSCLPRFDSDPRFCALLNDHGGGDKGFYDVELFDLAESRQCYRHNSAIVETTLTDKHGGKIQITDFAPRFRNLGRMFRPVMLIRQIRPLAGTPRIRIRIRPSYGYGQDRPDTTRGSNHIRYVMPDLTLRVTTDASVTYILDETPFVLERPVSLLLGPDESFTQPVAETCREFMEKTDDYWRGWSRSLSLPFEWQDAVIRAAITLKLCSFEETGAIVAAATTSVPEAADSGRNWDYRFCWLRDSYFVVHALNALGATRTMEEYLGYITNIVVATQDGYLQPVFGIALDRNLDETEVDTVTGYRGMGPVRVGNDAYRQVQNDGYGAVILASAQAFFDRRLEHPGDINLFQRLEKLGEQAAARWNQPDAGIWEYRNAEAVHTYSSVMCWAACDRLAKIAEHLHLADRTRFWADRAKAMKREILKRAWNPKLESFVSTFDGDSLDAVLLLLPQLGFIPVADPRYAKTVAQIEKTLLRGGHMFRYAVPDHLGMPRTAFNVCTFWYIEALAALGRNGEARALFETMLAARNSAGLLSEDLDPVTGELWGNFPQTYSMVGMIHCAMRLSKSWEEAI